ncbi:MAG: glycoside hydrolase [Actinobacteria bacterium]|nr:glycoside hydrolase [Actinomycetota bacterium]
MANPIVMRSKLLLFACLLALVFALTPARAQQFAAPRFTETVLRDAGGEPNVSISPSGKIVLVSGLGNDDPVTLYRSTDYGAHFTKLQPTFGSTGGGDWDMRFLDESTIIAADLGDGVHVDRSTDGGRTWSTTVVMEDTYDRPWIDHFGSDKVYLVAKGIADGFPYLYSSDDGGISFGDPPVPIIMYGAGIRPTETGGSTPTIIDVEASASNAYVDHLTVDPRTGDVYVLYGISGLNSFGALHPLGAENRCSTWGRLAGRTCTARSLRGAPAYCRSHTYMALTQIQPTNKTGLPKLRRSSAQTPRRRGYSTHARSSERSTRRTSVSTGSSAACPGSVRTGASSTTCGMRSTLPGACTRSSRRTARHRAEATRT